MQSQQKAGLSLSSLGFTDTQSEAEGEEIREGWREEREKRQRRIRNEAKGVLGNATAWAQSDPKGICEVHFRGSHGGHSAIF